jgi:hypothetical protein
MRQNSIIYQPQPEKDKSDEGRKKTAMDLDLKQDYKSKGEKVSYLKKKVYFFFVGSKK